MKQALWRSMGTWRQRVVPFGGNAQPRPAQQPARRRHRQPPQSHPPSRPRRSRATNRRPTSLPSRPSSSSPWSMSCSSSPPQETGLPIKSTVKRQITTRAAVESYLKEKFNEDEGAKRLQRDEIVLKKFGLLDRDFALKPFLLALLKEQIEAYYDSKTKTVNMLDWVDIDEQKPVLAHELTHALQDQHVDLEKWDDQTPDDVSTDSAGDTDHLAKDEMDTARDAVVEGQATAVMMDYILKPMGKSLVKDPEVMDFVKQQMSGSDRFAGAGARSAAALRVAAVSLSRRPELRAGRLDGQGPGRGLCRQRSTVRPPRPGRSSTRANTSRSSIPGDSAAAQHSSARRQALQALRHRPGGPARPAHSRRDLRRRGRRRDLTPAWNGGLYWAGQLRSATTAAEQASTKSLALFYLSVWKNAASAQAFAQLYANSSAASTPASSPTWPPSKPRPASLPDRRRSKSRSSPPTKARSSSPLAANWSSSPRAFDLDLARKLTALILDAQGTGELKMAGKCSVTPGSDCGLAASASASPNAAT